MSFHHHKLILGGGVFAAILSAVLGLCSMQPVFAQAEGSSGTGDGASGGSCAPSGHTGDYYDTCTGASWVKYEADSDYIEIPPLYDSNGNMVAPGGVIEGCKTHGGSYYRLGFAGAHYENGVFTGFTGKQAGLVPVDQIKPIYEGGKGNTNFVSGGSGMESWNTVMGDFNTALDHNVEGFTTDWTSGSGKPATSWFCWDEKWRDDDDDDDGKQEPTGGGDAGGNYFFSKSGIRVKAQGSDVKDHTLESDKDGSVEYRFSTDLPSVTVTLYHKMGYHHESPVVLPPDQCETVAAKWEVSGQRVTGQSSGSYGNFCNAATESESEVSTNEFTVGLSEGQTVKVCQRIDYDIKSVSYDEPYGVCDPVRKSCNPKVNPDYWFYPILSTGGSGASKACVTITKPRETVENDGVQERSTATVGGTLMYAGQDADLTFQGEGMSYPTRRLTKGEAIVYLLSSTLPPSASYTKGTIGQMNPRPNKNPPCSYFGSWEQCKILDSSSYSIGGESSPKLESFDRAPNMKVPNLVGHKYCNSFGFYYEYWHADIRNGSASWAHDSELDYWNVYNAACRAIAKKPSVAFWNGSMFTGPGVGVRTLTSLRYPANEDLFGQYSGGQRSTFGSWVEDAAVVGGTIQNNNAYGFASGSGLSRGGNVTSGLTISNDDSNGLGNSGIGANTAFYTRLNTYLKDQAKITDVNAAMNSTNSDTKIIAVNSDVNINRNIVLNRGPYNNIYRIPQVIIIVDGEHSINVSGNVDQIDAWIIAPSSSLNTCSEFAGSSSETFTVHTGDRSCDKRLMFNGPVMVNRIALNRTGGSDPMTGDNSFSSDFWHQRYTPAEVFNLSAETYLWAFAQAGRYSSSYTEAYIRELPPRY